MNGSAGLPDPIMHRGKTAGTGDREQSGETSLVESEEMCVSVEEERECLTQGRRVTEPLSDTELLYNLPARSVCAPCKVI